VDGVKFGPDWAAGITAADADLGANPGEIWITKKATLSSTAAPTITWANGRVLRFIDPGTYSLSVGWTIGAWVNQQSPAAFLCTDNVTLQFTGSAGMVFDGSAAANLMQLRLEKCQFSGNAAIANALTLKGISRSVIDNIKARNCTGTAILGQFLVNVVFIQPKVSSSDEAFTTQPTNGMLIDWVNSAANGSNDVSIFSPEMGAVSGDGIKIDHASEIRVIGGELVGNNIGVEITVGAGGTSASGHNTVDSVHFEANATNDIKITGPSNTIKNNRAEQSITNLSISTGDGN